MLSIKYENNIIKKITSFNEKFKNKKIRIICKIVYKFF